MTQPVISVDTLLQTALAHHQAGRLPEAQQLYQQILALQPNHADALHLSGLIAHQSGQHEEAARLIAQAIEVTPAAPLFCNLGVVLQALGRFQEAESHLKQAISLLPQYADAYNNLGNGWLAQELPLEAIPCFLQAISINPMQIDALNNLGNAYKTVGQLDDAVACYRKALAINPQLVDAMNNLGIALQSLGEMDEAAEWYRKTLQYWPQRAEVHVSLGTIYHAQGRYQEAIACFQQAMAISPDMAEAHQHLGITLYTLGDIEAAVISYRKALTGIKDSASLHNNLATALHALGRFDEAICQFDQAISLDNAFATAYNNRGLSYQAKGMLAEAIDSHQQAINIQPDYADAHGSLIFASDMKFDVPVATQQAERQRWADRHAAKYLPATTQYGNARDPDKKLRIGYISADFKRHSAATVFAAMLCQFDPLQFEVFAYSNAFKVDQCTQLFQQHVSHWRNIVALSDDEVVALIRQDQLDILVDLSGHSAGNRLLVFARKPAPIQITAWGYIGGTGMKVMDVFLADEVVVPPDEQHLYAEKVVYLPSVVCYYPFEPFPSVNALPALSGQPFTFGSFNRLAKVTEESFNLWAQVLLAVPNSRMILKTAELDDPAMQAHVRNTFTQAGVASSRIILQGKTSWSAHMAAFNQVDVALDPFPHGGGVTTLEGVIMGIPTVTLRWPTLLGRLSAALITPIGLTDWIAESPEQYLQIAVEKAADLLALAVLRKQLRSRMLLSPVGDTLAYARAVENVYRQLWQEWCAAS